MVQRLLVGAADIHARPAPYRFQSFQNLDIGCTVAFAAILGGAVLRALGSLHERIRRPRTGAWLLLWLLVRIAEKIVHFVHAL